MASNLYCEANETPDFDDEACAINVVGPGAVLDCAGFHIAADPGETQDLTRGICLRGGATAINCNVSGFYTGKTNKDKTLPVHEEKSF